METPVASAAPLARIEPAAEQNAPAPKAKPAKKPAKKKKEKASEKVSKEDPDKVVSLDAFRKK